MPKSFKCPSCSAPLEYEGTTAQKCTFCASTVIVDSEVKSHFDERPDFGFGSLLDQAQKLKEVKRLVRAGKKIEAIKEYREIFGCGLKEAKEAVDNIEAGRPIVFTSYQMSQSGHPAEFKLPEIKIDPQTVEAAKKASISAAIIGIVALVIVGFIVAGIVFVIFSAGTTTTTVGNSSATLPSGGLGKASPTPTPQWATEVAKFGSKGIGPGQFKDNRSIAVDQEGNVYTGDYSDSGKIQVLGPDGNFKRQIEINPDRVMRDLAIDRAGNLFVLMGSNIHRYEAATGNSLGTITGSWKTDLAVGMDGLIYATTQEGDIAAMTPDGKETKRFKKVIEQANLKRFSLERLAVDGEGNFFILERMGCFVLKFNREGKFLNRFGGCNEPGEEKNKALFDTSPQEIAVDNKGHVFVSDVGKIYVFNSEGNFIDIFTSSQSFGMFVTDKNEMWVAARPHVLKYQLPD